MQTTKNETLKRKQIMLSDANIAKLEMIAKEQGTSSAEIVRNAIDSYDPDLDGMDVSELIELAITKLNETTSDIASLRKQLNKTIKKVNKHNNKLKEVA